MFVLAGRPKEGQSLAEVKRLMLAEIDKLKRGDFPDDLLPAVVNNMRLAYYTGLQSNDFRANQFVEAFINDEPWADRALAMNRVANMTKQQIVGFANRFFLDDYVTVYKRQGEDTTIHKIDKPEITPIPTNNDKQSEFLREVVNLKPAPIQPRFVDFKKDLTVTKTKRGLAFLYKKNVDDELFTLVYHYPFGDESDNQLAFAADYLDYVGTASLTKEAINRKFYSLACSYSVNVSADAVDITVSGLNANMPEAVSMLETIINGAKADKDSYAKYVDVVLKARADAKSNQRSNYAALRQLGMFGQYNAQLNTMSEAELRAANPQALLDKLKALQGYRHTLLYYGPTALKDIDNLVGRVHITPKKLAAAPAAKPYLHQSTPKTEVWLAPYDAKNVYMTMYHNEGQKWSPDKAAVEALFNAYFGGGMNAVVFQELREARGLAYSASAAYTVSDKHPFADTESFNTYIITQNDKLMDCINEFNVLLDSMPQRQAGFDLAKQSLMKSIATKRVTRGNVLWSYLSAKKLGLNCDLDQKRYEDIPKLTLQNLIDFARQNISHKPYRYLILGDEKSLDMGALKKIGPVRRLTTRDIFGF